MVENAEFTHELLAEDVKYYMKEEDYVSKIKSYFEEIYDINNVFLDEAVAFSSIIPSIRVHGLVHLYGFKVEDGGFFDVVNGRYYSNDEKIVKKGKIIPSISLEKEKKEEHVLSGLDNKTAIKFKSKKIKSK